MKRANPMLRLTPQAAGELERLHSEIDRLKGLDHNQILAESAARHLINSGAKNYTGEVFTITLDDGSEAFEVVVTTQRVGAKCPHELHSEAVTERDSLHAQLAERDALLLWALYHHQGGKSDVGQPIRRLLGIGQHDDLTDEQITAATLAGRRS